MLWRDFSTKVWLLYGFDEDFAKLKYIPFYQLWIKVGALDILLQGDNKLSLIDLLECSREPPERSLKVSCRSKRFHLEFDFKKFVKNGNYFIRHLGTDSFTSLKWQKDFKERYTCKSLGSFWIEKTFFLSNQRYNADKTQNFFTLADYVNSKETSFIIFYQNRLIT